MSLISEEDLVPELGDRITIVSKAYGTITGRIIYRDENVIRVKPQVSMTMSRRLYDFPTNPETGEFQESLGVGDVQIHAKRSSPWFSKQLAVLPDSELLLYSSDPTPERVRVINIIATEDEDAIIIRREGKEEPEQINFDFIGPPSPLVYIEPTVSEPPLESVPFQTEPEPTPEFDINLLETGGAVFEIERKDQSYPDRDQLEDMVTSLLSEHPVETHANDRLLTILQKQASTLLSLKNSTLKQSYSATTLLEAIQLTEEPLEAVLPVANIRRSLYIEDAAQETELYKAQNEVENFGKMLSAAESGFDTTSDARGNRFARYVTSILTTGSGLSEGTLSTEYLAKRVIEDQEVFRAPGGSRTQGLVSDLPAGHRIYGKTFREDTKLKQRFIGSINHQIYRLNNEMVIKHPEDGHIIQVVKADLLDPLTYLLLPPFLARQRSTLLRSGTLLWDVQQSEAVRSLTDLSKKITESTDIQTINDTMEIADILSDRIQYPFYNYSNPMLRQSFDELGLRHLEWTSEIKDVVADSLHTYQKEWTYSFEEAKKRAAKPTTNVPVVSSAVDSSSTLLTLVESVPLLQEISKQVKAHESSLQGLDLVLAESLLTETRRTRIPLWWGTTAQVPESKTQLEIDTKILESEIVRLSTVAALSAEKELSYHAEPIINSCEHVKELESIRGVEVEKDRMILLDMFYKKYEGGLKDNWIQCNVCKQDLICRHEILVLQEYKQKSNTSVFQKTMRMQFIGGQFEGKYICKNCGIIIGEIEYDTNPEFDDEGNIMQGRSVLTNDEPAPTLDILDVATALQERNNEENEIAKHKLNIFNVVKDLFENAGANPSDEIYNKCMSAIYNQLLSMEDPYKQRILSILKAKTPDESVIVASLLVILSTAYVIAELQISENALPIFITRQGCPFSRDGIPRDKEGTGLLDYMICILLNIESDSYPWTTTLWASRNGEARRNIILQEVKYTLREISKLPTVADALQGALKIKEQIILDEKAPLFRSRIGAPTAITNREAFQRSIYQDPIQSIRAEVIGRTEALSQDMIQAAHQYALDTKEDLRGQSKRLDGQCGRTKLGDIGSAGFGIVALQSEGTQQEVQLLREAIPILLQRDPSHSLGMSHFITPWSAKVHQEPFVPNVESLSFRLFLKACASGPNVGQPHEYGIDRVCRRCGVRSPVEILNLTVEENFIDEKETVEKPGKKLDELREKLQEIATQKDSVSLQVLKEADIRTDHESFLSLQDQIHMRRKVNPIIDPPSMPWMDRMSDALENVPSLLENWNQFKKFFTEPIVSEKDRIAKFVPISNLITSYMRIITVQYGILIGTAANKTVTAFIPQLESIVVMGNRSTNALQTMFINPLKRIATGIESSIKGSKLIKGITLQHEQVLQDIWKKQYEIIDSAILELDAHEEYKETVYTVLNRFTTLIGSVFEICIESVRISSIIHESEFKDLIRWILIGSFSLAIDHTSLFYNITENVIYRKSAALFIGKIVFKLFGSIQNQLFHINKTPEQIRGAIEARKQQERQKFIQKQDKLKSTEEKRADNLMKRFGLGDYSEGALKKKFAYDADYFEFHRNQRVEYGLPEFSPDITNAEQGSERTLRIEEAGTFDEYIGANEYDD